MCTLEHNPLIRICAPCPFLLSAACKGKSPGIKVTSVCTGPSTLDRLKVLLDKTFNVQLPRLHYIILQWPHDITTNCHPPIICHHSSHNFVVCRNSIKEPRSGAAAHTLCRCGYGNGAQWEELSLGNVGDALGMSLPSPSLALYRAILFPFLWSKAASAPVLVQLIASWN